jgi:hypothetical protein
MSVRTAVAIAFATLVASEPYLPCKSVCAGPPKWPLLNVSLGCCEDSECGNRFGKGKCVTSEPFCPYGSPDSRAGPQVNSCETQGCKVDADCHPTGNKTMDHVCFESAGTGLRDCGFGNCGKDDDCTAAAGGECSDWSLPNFCQMKDFQTGPNGRWCSYPSTDNCSPSGGGGGDCLLEAATLRFKPSSCSLYPTPPPPPCGQYPAPTPPPPVPAPSCRSEHCCNVCSACCFTGSDPVRGCDACVKANCSRAQ